jgi:hypothetical protein
LACATHNEYAKRFLEQIENSRLIGQEDLPPLSLTNISPKSLYIDMFLKMYGKTNVNFGDW